MAETRVSAQQKQAVFERAGGRCEYCRSQARFAIQPFSVEHIEPRRKGGVVNLRRILYLMGEHPPKEIE